MANKCSQWTNLPPVIKFNIHVGLVVAFIDVESPVSRISRHYPWSYRPIRDCPCG